MQKLESLNVKILKEFTPEAPDLYTGKKMTFKVGQVLCLHPTMARGLADAGYAEITDAEPTLEPPTPQEDTEGQNALLARTSGGRAPKARSG